MAITVGRLQGSAPAPEGRPGACEADREAFDRFYREFVPRVAGYVRRHIHDYELIDEIIQETLLRAYRHGLHLEAGTEHWRWLSTVARNLCIDQRELHRNWRESSVEQPETFDLTAFESDPEAHAIATERREIVARALAHLTEQERRLLVLKHVEGRRVREMANLEGMHVEALKSALRRARKSFHESYVAVTDRTGVASVFGPAMAAAALRLRGWRARFAQTAERVSAVSANIVPTGDALHSAVVGAAVVGLALGPGLDGLRPGGTGSGAGESSQSSEVAWAGEGDAGAPALAASRRAGASTGGGPSVDSGVWSPGDANGDGPAPGGGDPGGGDGGLTPDAPGGPGPFGPDPGDGSTPLPGPVDLGGEDEVEEPEDTYITDFAHAPTSGSSNGSGEESGGLEQGMSSGTSDDGTENSESGGTTAQSPPADDDSSTRAESAGSEESEAEATSTKRDSATTSETGDPRTLEDTSSDGAGEVPELFALGTPVPDKRGDCELDCTVLWRSVDGGATWDRLPAKGLVAERILLAPDYPVAPRIYAFGRLGLFVSTDGGHTFELAAPVPGEQSETSWTPGHIAHAPGGGIAVASRSLGTWVFSPALQAFRPLALDVYHTSGLASGTDALMVAARELPPRARGFVHVCTALSCERRYELPFSETTATVATTSTLIGDVVWLYEQYVGGRTLGRSDDGARSFVPVMLGDDQSWRVSTVTDDGKRIVVRAHRPSGDRQPSSRWWTEFAVFTSMDGEHWSAGAPAPGPSHAQLSAVPGGRLLVNHGLDRDAGLLCSADDGQTWSPRCPEAPPGSGSAG